MNVEHPRNKVYLASFGKRWLNWFNLSRRSPGMWAFVLNRITAIGLTVYLLIHLAILSLLTQGEAIWDSFVTIARSPAMLILDVILIAGILIHGLNGIRVAFVGLGFGVSRHKPTFVRLMVIALVVLIYAGYRIFTT